MCLKSRPVSQPSCTCLWVALSRCVRGTLRSFKCRLYTDNKKTLFIKCDLCSCLFSSLKFITRKIHTKNFYVCSFGERQVLQTPLSKGNCYFWRFFQSLITYYLVLLSSENNSSAYSVWVLKLLLPSAYAQNIPWYPSLSRISPMSQQLESSSFNICYQTRGFYKFVSYSLVSTAPTS
jgi:hypothetical protein